MFQLNDNNFLESGSCKYLDQHNNSVFVRRTETGFVAKLRFCDDRIATDPFYVNMHDVGQEKGNNLLVRFRDKDVLKEQSVIDGQEGFKHLVGYWIEMLTDIKFLDCNNEILLAANTGCKIEEIAEHKMERIKKYKELEQVVATVFG